MRARESRRVVARCASMSSSPCAGSWWNSASRRAPGLAGDVHRVVDRAVAPVPLRLVLGRRVLRVVDQQVDAVAELEHLVRDVVVGVLGTAARAVVGEVRDRHAVPARPGSRASGRRGAPSASAPSRRPTGKSSSPVSWKRTSPVSWSGRIGKNGGRIISREHLAERALVLARPVHVERRALAVQRREERQALHVVPVQVREQRGAVEHARRTVARTGAARCRGRRGSAAASSVSSATHDEWPPKRAYSGPAHGVEPRTPLNTTRDPPGHGRGGYSRRRRDDSAPSATARRTESRRSPAVGPARWRSTHSPRTRTSDRRRRRHRHRRPDQGLRRPRRTGPGRREPRPGGAPGRDLRAARPERRGQDDHRRHADDPGDPDRRARRGRRHRRRRPPGGRQAGHRRRAADEHARPLARRRREPLLPRPLLRHERPGSARARPASCSSSSGSPTAPPPTSTSCRAAWRSG